MTERQRKLILEIANEMGVTIGGLLKNKSAEVIIEEYKNKTFQILND